MGSENKKKCIQKEKEFIWLVEFGYYISAHKDDKGNFYRQSSGNLKKHKQHLVIK